MRVQEVNNWNVRQTVQTDESPHGDWCGIAIGPESEEGLVRVNGVLLQAGRVLPIRGRTYKVERVLGLVDSAAHAADVTLNLTSVTRLQLLLFEDVAELGIRVPRANVSFASKTNLVTAVFPATTRVLTIPFIGRRQALFSYAAFFGDGASCGYRVFGRRFCMQPEAPGSPRPNARIEEYLLASNSSSTLPFYIGGTNEGEDWHELAYELCLLTANSTVLAEVEVIGEIGDP